MDPSHPYKFLGRFDVKNPNSFAYGAFSWPGSGVGATFMGTSLSVQLEDPGSPVDGNRVNNWFDGKWTRARQWPFRRAPA